MNVIEKVKNNKYKNYIVIIIIIIVFYSLFKLYKYFQNKTDNEPYLINGVRKCNYIIDNKSTEIIKPKMSSYKEIKNEIFKKNNYGNDYTYSFWIKIDDLTYNYGKFKHIFHKGDKEANSVNPGIWIYPKTNDLMIRIATFNMKTKILNKNTTISGRKCQNWNSQTPHKHKYNSEYRNKGIGNHNYCRNPSNYKNGNWCYTTDPKKKWEACGFNDINTTLSMNPYNYLNNHKFNEEKCDINNIPIQRWIHIVIQLHNKTLDVYINGKLRRSCVYENVPLLNDESLHITDNGGFNGEISDLQYFNKAITPSKIYSIYNSGYKKFNIGNLLYNLKSKINFSK